MVTGHDRANEGVGQGSGRRVTITASTPYEMCGADAFPAFSRSAAKKATSSSRFHEIVRAKNPLHQWPLPNGRRGNQASNGMIGAKFRY